MGFSSYECKACGHSVLSSSSVDPEINEWMKDVVILGENGTRLIAEFDGYSGHYDEQVGYGGGVWLHQACWEVAGKPEYEAFDGPSPSAEDQGYFFGKEHDLIDPRITDEAERERLLAEGIVIREKRWYNGRARKVSEWLDPNECRYHSDEKKAEPWRHRYSYFQTCLHEENGDFVKDEDGKAVRDPEGWHFSDNLDPDIPYEDRNFRGTEDELKAELAARWARFVESDEAAAYLAHRKKIRDEAQAEEFAKIKAEGRYEVSRKEAKGDTVVKEGDRDWTGRRSIYTVRDRLSYKEVAVFDAPNKALGRQTFQGKYPEERIEAMHASGQESSELAKAEAGRLNKQWEADGYPWDWDELG